MQVLDLALAQLPARYRPGHPGAGRVLLRSDSAGATHELAQACVDRGVEFSFGFPVTARIQDIVDLIPESCWDDALATCVEEFRDGAWVAEATGMVKLKGWPGGARLVLRKERPHPGAQLTFTDVDGHRITALLTNTRQGSCPATPPAWNCANASTPASRTASAKPRPWGCATCPATKPR